MPHFCYHQDVGMNMGMWGNTEMVFVIHQRIRTCHWCLTYTDVFTLAFSFS